MKTIASFYTEAEALDFIDWLREPRWFAFKRHDNVLIDRGLDGRYHVVDMS